MATVKLYSIKSEGDAALMNEVKPGYVGFVSVPGERQISMASAYRFSNIIRYSRLIGAFVNEQPVAIAKIVKQTGPDVIQLHEDENDVGTRQLKESCNCEIWKALRTGQIEDMDATASLHADRLLIDSYVQSLRGGSGK